MKILKILGTVVQVAAPVVAGVVGSPALGAVVATAMGGGKAMKAVGKKIGAETDRPHKVAAPAVAVGTQIPGRFVDCQVYLLRLGIEAPFVKGYPIRRRNLTTQFRNPAIDRHPPLSNVGFASPPGTDSAAGQINLKPDRFTHSNFSASSSSSFGRSAILASRKVFKNSLVVPY